MSNPLAALIGGTAAAGTTLQDILDKAAPGLSFLPAFLRAWLQVDISHVIGILSLFGAMSGGVDFLGRISTKLYWMLTRFCTASISVAPTDRLNREVLNWVSVNVLARQNTRILAARSEPVDTDHYSWRHKTTRDDYRHERRPPVEYHPTFGITIFWHRMRLFVVRRVPTNSRRGGFLTNETPDEYVDAPTGREPLVIMCFGRSVEPVKKFLQDCREFNDRQREECVTIRLCKGAYSEWVWDTTILRPLRPIGTVHFDENVKQELVEDIANYLHPQTRRFYHQRGIPYRRGYLLHGPPGTGKTSLSLALAGMFGLELYLLHIPGISSDKELAQLFAELPPRCIVLLEDIDAVGIQKRRGLDALLHKKEGDEIDEGEGEDEDESDSEANDIRARSSLSGLLNVIDGVASQEGRIVFMTSNMADKLDPALVRPGRIDRKIYLGNINQESARLMFLRMYGRDVDFNTSMDLIAKQGSARAIDEKQEHTDGVPSGPHDVSPEELEKLAAEFAQHVPENTLTPALLQGYLISHRKDPRAAAEGMEAWGKTEVERLEKERELEKKRAEKKARRKKMRALKASRALGKMYGDGSDAILEGMDKKVKALLEKATTKVNGVEPDATTSTVTEVAGKKKEEEKVEEAKPTSLDKSASIAVLLLAKVADSAANVSNVTGVATSDAAKADAVDTTDVMKNDGVQEKAKVAEKESDGNKTATDERKANGQDGKAAGTEETDMA